jgi:FMN reductase
MLGRTLERQGRSDEAVPWLRMAGALSGAGDEDAERA